ncbi:MAG: transporter substrate-binding protein [Pirellulales bacterium]
MAATNHPDPTPSGAEPQPNRAPADLPTGEDTLGETQYLSSDTASRSPTGAGDARKAAIDAWVGKRLGRYQIRGVLGVGGMGVVYLGYDEVIDREVAVKMLPDEVSENSVNLQRFLSEAKAAGKLNHPNTVAIYEVGQEGKHYYLVMEYVTGGSVADQMERTGSLSVYDATRVTADACRGLAAANAAGMVHRDIKPANLLYARDGAIKIADFGLAKQAVDPSRQVTQAGKIVGTPYFMSPEQCESKPIDHRSDIYSLGATYYCMLTGINPYDSMGSVVQVMYAHCNGPILDPRAINSRVPAACSQIVARAMAKRPEDRYQHPGEMLADLEALLATVSGVNVTLPSQSGTYVQPLMPPMEQRSRAKPIRLLLAAVTAVALLLAAGAYALFVRRPPADPATLPAANVASILPAAATIPTGPPIRIGILHSITGTMAESESPVVDAALLAVDELNEAGGVLGRPVEAVVRDGRSDPEVFAQEARRLLGEDKISTVFGCWTSASRKTVVPIFERHDGLLVYPVQYEGLEESPNVLYLGATPNQQIIPAVRWAFAFLGKRRFFLVGSDYVFPRAANAIIGDTLREMNAEVVGEAYLPMGSYDVKPVIEQILSSRADVIVNTINGSSNVPFFKELRAAGVTPEQLPTISFSIGEQELRLMNVSEMIGDYAAWNYFQSIGSPENRGFVERFHASYSRQRVITDPMEAAYVGVKLWAEAVEQAKTDDVRVIRQAILEQHMLAPEGELRIDAATRHAYKTPRIGQIQDKAQFEVVWEAVRPEAPQPFPPSRTKEAWQQFLADLYAGWGDHWTAPEK